MKYQIDSKASVIATDVASIPLTPGNVLVQVHALCLLPSDSSKAGLSFAGTVLEAFEGGLWQIGAKVWGFSTSREYTDQVTVPEWAVHKMKTNLTFSESATLAGPALLSVHALETAGLPADKKPRVLVHGGHTAIGTFAIQVARIMKCEVEATTPLEYRARCRELGCNEFVDLIEGTPHGATLASFRGRRERNFHLVIDTLADDASLYDYIEKYTHENAKYMTIKERSVSWAGFVKKLTTSVPRAYEYLTNPLTMENANKYLGIVNEIPGQNDFVSIELQEEFVVEDLPAAIRAVEKSEGFGCVIVQLVSPDSTGFQNTLLEAQANGLKAKSQKSGPITPSSKSRDGRKSSLSLPVVKSSFGIE